MTQQLLNHIKRYNLCKISDKILLAVSGGLDSMVMLNLFRHAGFSIAVAHCNFQLRGDESAGDENFIRTTCTNLGLPLHVQAFDTASIAKEEKQSIQVTARELRYDFFQNIVKQYQYDVIATAHHLDDVFETIIINLTRGTGIDGLIGIPVKTNNIIRPLLFASREDLLAYAKQEQLLWREDSSNEKDDYQRNFVRHQVIPLLKKLNPGFNETFKDTHKRVVAGHAMLKMQYDKVRDVIFRTTGNRTYINKQKLFDFAYPAEVLWELLKESGFNYTQCIDIVEVETAGKIFYSHAYQLSIDRSEYILEKRSFATSEIVFIEQGSEEAVRGNEKLKITIVTSEKFLLKKESAIAQLDFDKIEFPLSWRSWQPGDALIPLGMNASKKVSDVLIDAKVALPDKAQVTVLESAGQIIWIVGMRINNRFKVTETTGQVLILELKQG